MEQTQVNKEKTKKLKLDFKDSKYSTGRRKKSIAKVWVKKGSGKIFVNGKLMGDYFKRIPGVLKSANVWVPVNSDIKSPDLKFIALAFPSPVPEAKIHPVTPVSK